MVMTHPKSLHNIGIHSATTDTNFITEVFINEE